MSYTRTCKGKTWRNYKVTNNKIRNFWIHATKTNKGIGQIITEMSYQLIDPFHMEALQNLEEYD